MQNISQNNLMIMINNDTFIQMIDVCKATKLSLFRISINIEGEILSIYSSDIGMNYICSYFENHNDMKEFISLYFTKENIDNLDTSIKIYGDFEVQDSILVSNITNTALPINTLSLGSNFYYIKNTFEMKISYINKIIKYNTDNSSYTDYGNINDDESIVSLSGMKVSDNIIPYIKDNFYMTLYKGFIPLAKSDKINLIIFPNIFNTNTFIADFRIKKKKNIVLDFYYMYLQV